MPFDRDDVEPPYAVVEVYEPPHSLAIPEDLCDRILAAARSARPSTRLNGEHRAPVLEPDDERAVLDRIREANDAWWCLAIDEWDTKSKRYRPGDQLIAHQDIHAGAARRKIAASVQLSDPTDYEGGDFVVWFNNERIPMPRTRGTVIVLPGWTVHAVEEVTSGERWSLLANGWGPPLR